jgi:hypothetical protein
MSDPRDLLLAQAARTIRVEDDSFNINSVTLGSLAPEVFAALQAVLDLHKPEEFAVLPLEEGDIEFICTDCSAYRPVEAWPCDTVQAITTALETT